MENNNNNRIGYNPFMKRIVILMMLIVAMLQTALGQVQITTIPSSGANILQVGTAKQTFTVIIKKSKHECSNFEQRDGYTFPRCCYSR